MNYKLELDFEYQKSMFILFISLVIVLFTAFLSLKGTGKINNEIGMGLLILILLVVMLIYQTNMYQSMDELKKKLK